MEYQNHRNKLSQNKQFELFSSEQAFANDCLQNDHLKQDSKSILNWRDKIYNHQKTILCGKNNLYSQKSLANFDNDNLDKINPFELKGFSINFWRSNKYVHNGPAMYFVVDTLENKKIILYIGETQSADSRWKGVHDCKNYINNYKESLAYSNIRNHLDIRFYLDVPKEVKFRRKLEQKLIYLWLPPFNKETRNRWSTTFTNN